MTAADFAELRWGLEGRGRALSLRNAGSFNNLGIMASDRGDLAKAEEYGRQAPEIRRKLAPGSLDVARMAYGSRSNRRAKYFLVGSRGQLSAMGAST
jgi:Tfp pilus assembly protein PilF